jgi:hypothetical protein
MNMSKLDLKALLDAPCESVTELVSAGHKEEVASRKRMTYRDAKTGYEVTLTGKKVQRDQYAMLRKMFRGCITDGEQVHWFGDEEHAGSSSKLRKYKLVDNSPIANGILIENYQVREEAAGRKADIIRGIGKYLFTDVQVYPRGEHLEAILARNASTDEVLVEAFLAMCNLARLATVRSSNGVLIRIHKLSMKPKWVAPIVCPVVDAAQQKDLAGYCIYLGMKKNKGIEDMRTNNALVKTQKIRKILGPRDFPRWMNANVYYTDNPDMDEVVQRDGTRVKLNQNYKIFMTWDQYMAKQDVRTRYQVDPRTKKRRKSKSKGGSGGGKAFTGKSHSSVFKNVARSCK